jgi:hypothetical protein
VLVISSISPEIVLGASFFMPITAVIRGSSHGALQQVQVGPADLVATVTAAHSAWGWIGGLSGIANLLGYSKDKTEVSDLNRLFDHVDLDSSTCRILGQQGLVEVDLGETGSKDAFGGTFASQIIGLTFCALAHNMQIRSATKMCVSFVIDGFFKKGLSAIPGAREAVVNFLQEKNQVILNEGLVRGLPAKFDEAISAVGIGSAGNACGDHAQHSQEAPFIFGFFRWARTSQLEPYHTRSAAVARIAASLRAVGYKLGPVIVWSGNEPSPQSIRSLVLVTGGSSDTDMFAPPENAGGPSIQMISHYRWNTIGAMLWNAHVRVSKCFVETYQSDFEDTDKDLMEELHGFQWAVVDLATPEKSQEIQAYPVWKSSSPQGASSTARKLASHMFRASSDRVAHLYEPIAKKKYLAVVSPNERVRRFDTAILDTDESRRYHALSVCICMSVLAQIGGEDFRKVQHSTTLSLMHDKHARWLCHRVDMVLQGGCGLSSIVQILATIHCAKEFPTAVAFEMAALESPMKNEDEISTQVVGWKIGRYAVLPSVLFRLGTPIDKDILNLTCVDEFIANIPTRRDGSVHSPGVLTSRIFFDTAAIGHQGSILHPEPELEAGTIVRNDPIVLSQAKFQSADQDVYISIERSGLPSAHEPDITLWGRVDGAAIGCVGIQDVLRTLCLSWNDELGYPLSICRARDDPQQCQGGNKHRSHADMKMVVNMPISCYIKHSDITRIPAIPQPMVHGKEAHSIFVQVAGSTPWTLLLAGQSPELNRVSFGCVACAMQSGSHVKFMGKKEGQTIIGYG